MDTLLELPSELAVVAQGVALCLERVEKRFADHLASDIPAVDRLCRHVERYRGKMLRPTLVLACGLAADRRSSGGFAGVEDVGGLVTESHVTVAAVCEMIHMATLVHDDVLDEADARRRGATVNHLYGNELAVILGDYLFSAAYHLCSTLSDASAGQETALLIGQTGMTLCTGELLQLSRRGDLSLDEPTYFAIIERKTASLIAAACRLGARHSGATVQQADALASFGRGLGLAFQIQDDLLDLTGREDVVGKSVQRDLALGKLTLPLIHHLATVDDNERAYTLAMLSPDVAGGSAGVASDSGGKAVLLADRLSASGSIDYAAARATGLIREAESALTVIEDSPARGYLAAMAEALISRTF